ncbi:MAG: hypothetical protein WA949_06485 [Phormidesmis sp.]
MNCWSIWSEFRAAQQEVVLREGTVNLSFQDHACMVIALLDMLELECVDAAGYDTGGAVALILAIEHAQRVNRLVISNSVCYDRFDNDMLDFGYPLRWKPRPVSDLVEALEESLALGLSDKSRLTPDFRQGMIAPWQSEEGKLSWLRNASALNANPQCQPSMPTRRWR